MIYVDTSVVLAALWAEDRRPDNDFWDGRLVSSRLLEYETFTRVNAVSGAIDVADAARFLVGSLDMVEMTPAVLGRALEAFPVPVRMLDALSAELPDFVWLTELTQRAGMVTIDGMAASLVSVADYIRKLEDSDWFQNVELVDASVNTRLEQEFTEFQLRTQLVSPTSSDSQAGGAGSPAGAR